MGKYIISFLLTLLAAGQSFAWSGTGSAFLPEADSLFTAVDTSSGDLHIKKKFLPVSRRIDRGINDITYVYKNEIAIGLDVSYGTLSSDDTNIMLMIDGLDFKGSVFTVNPSVGYFFTDNICVGTRFGYSKIDGNLGNVTLDIGMDDLDLSLSDILLRSQVTTMGLFLRSYAGVDPKGVFGLFAELELAYRTGNSMFSYNTSEGAQTTHTNNYQARLGISAGVSVYIMPKLCCNLSFGLGGISYNKIRQHDAAGIYTGGRTATSMNWKLNLLDIGIGFNVHL
ncbi:MAG: hypothetical protein IAC29_01620 [Bacteroidetes bacterium]|uniref:Outer membrane protein beta-barrel domain-containing protein n=1 Tax=Candidatus Cryptobacteroides merdigallinarum TaxID=2840770 RepID=A0A9D9EMN3_9BACT|nr:hypothetical protein [Candidatus Cryptobacteroides merdigallinarum]